MMDQYGLFGGFGGFNPYGFGGVSNPYGGYNSFGGMGYGFGGFNPYMNYGGMNFGSGGFNPYMNYGGMNFGSGGGLYDDLFNSFQTKLDDLFKGYQEKLNAGAIQTQPVVAENSAAPSTQQQQAQDPGYQVGYKKKKNSMYGSQEEKQAAYNKLTADQQKMVQSGKAGVGTLSMANKNLGNAQNYVSGYTPGAGPSAMVSGQLTQLTGPGAQALAGTQKASTMPYQNPRKI